ncbi:MAG TPA: hypothetical protein VJT69_08425 [Pyrinomonadaceae bacterium]|nr:hypothetical protein [Pyrinomonadaceae bacterium]
MKRILLKIAVSVLTFVLGVTVSAFWHFYTYVSAPLSAVIPSPVLKFDTVVIGCGSQITASSYSLSNGAEITRTCQHFSSDAEARNVLDARRGGDGYDLVEWSSKIDADGERIGESVLLFSSQSVVRINRDGATLCETRAPTLGNLRWFENGEY